MEGFDNIINDMTGFDSLYGFEIPNIYLKISVIDNNNFDYLNKLNYVYNIINEIYDNKFKLISNEILLADKNLLNTSFVKLLKHCIDNKFENFAIILIAYCDYFDLDYNESFNLFHDKIQALIKKSSKSFIGKEQYNKAEKNRINKKVIHTLEELSKSKL